MPTTEPIESAEEINQIAFGFMASKALFSALHIGLFNALAEGARSAEQVAAVTGVAQRSVETLLTALAGIGLVTLDDDGYANGPAAAAYLVKGAKDYFGDYLSQQIDRQMYPAMDGLVAALQGDYDRTRYENYESWMDDPEEAEIYSRSQHVGSLGPGAVLGKRVDLSEAGHLLDIGGGTGGISIMLCRRYPDLQATIMDFPNVAEVGREFVEEAGLTDRIDYQPGNVLEEDWPEGVDAVLMSYISGSVSGDAVPALYEKAADALNPGGVCIVHDFMVDDSRDGPPMAALWALQHMAFTPGAVSLTPSFVTDALAGAGLTPAGVEPLIPGMTRVAVAEKR